MRLWISHHKHYRLFKDRHPWFCYPRYIIRNDATKDEKIFSGLWYSRKQMKEILRKL
jgi:hypothetical protein